MQLRTKVAGNAISRHNFRLDKDHVKSTGPNLLNKTRDARKQQTRIYWKANKKYFTRLGLMDSKNRNACAMELSTPPSVGDFAH